LLLRFWCSSVIVIVVGFVVIFLYCKIVIAFVVGGGGVGVCYCLLLFVIVVVTEPFLIWFVFRCLALVSQKWSRCEQEAQLGRDCAARSFFRWTVGVSVGVSRTWRECLLSAIDYL
jgi:hypothetical protein